MGVPSVSYAISVPRPLFLLAKFLFHLKSFIVATLWCFSRNNVSNNRSNRYRSVTVQEVLPAPATIKSELQAIEFTSFSEKLKARKICQNEHNHLCTVCLETFELSDEVRELGNCHHAFHKDCIDQWIDVGQVTCPLCRARLMPSKQSKNRVLRIFKESFLIKRFMR